MQEHTLSFYAYRKLNMRQVGLHHAPSFFWRENWATAEKMDALVF